MQTDIHQHIWTTPLLDALAARATYPFVERTREGLTVLHAAGEPPWVVDLDAQTVSARRRSLERDGIELAAMAISSPIGIEALEPDEAQALIDAHLDGVLALGSGFAAWGPVAIADPDPGQVQERLERGCIGISVTAGAIADRAGLQALLPVLAAAQAADTPVLIHPGPGLGARPAAAPLGDPLWWPALTDYVGQMQAAWLTFVSVGRRELPRLQIVFAMLAGGAPLLAERLAARGGPQVELRDPDTYYDTSSFGPRMVETMARWVGPAQIVYGSDRPVVDPVATGREAELMAAAGALLAPGRVLAARVAA
jgi:predicted TIM-barrel fold metal-dependent hydrolase